MNRYAESLLKPFELQSFQEVLMDFFTIIYKQLYIDSNVKLDK
jgi:hypothetical protein